jgi:hypothetical protein
MTPNNRPSQPVLSRDSIEARDERLVKAAWMADPVLPNGYRAAFRNS